MYVPRLHNIVTCVLGIANLNLLELLLFRAKGQVLIKSRLRNINFISTKDIN